MTSLVEYIEERLSNFFSVNIETTIHKQDFTVL